MKTNYMKVALIGAMVAGIMIASVMVTSCVGSKQAGNISTADKIKQMEDEAALIRTQSQLEDAKAEAERAKEKRAVDAALAKEQAKLDLEQARKMVEIMENQSIMTPCIKDVLKAQAEGNLAALGIGEPNGNDAFNEQEAYADAQVNARNRMGDMFLGYLKNISNDYKARTVVPLGSKQEESNFERAVRTGGEKAIGKFTEFTCFKMTKTDRNTYKCYMAVQIASKKLQESIATELDVLKVKYHQKTLFDILNEDIAKMNEKENKGMQDMLKNEPLSEE
ncbi:hypothetical protein FACS1894201_06670 [Bacteroidia bacterium]|nr:hypothetical protein FACS1894201_06670 [Bacteroidia bacterium]